MFIERICNWRKPAAVRQKAANFDGAAFPVVV